MQEKMLILQVATTLLGRPRDLEGFTIPTQELKFSKFKSKALARLESLILFVMD